MVAPAAAGKVTCALYKVKPAGPTPGFSDQPEGMGEKVLDAHVYVDVPVMVGIEVFHW